MVRQIVLNERRWRWAELESGASSRLQMVTAEGKLAEMIGARNEAQKALLQAQANLRGLKSE